MMPLFIVCGKVHHGCIKCLCYRGSETVSYSTMMQGGNDLAIEKACLINLSFLLGDTFVFL